MSMNTPDHDTFREWLHLEVDGDLPPERGARLSEHLGSCAACQAERRELVRMGELLQRDRLPVRADFRAEVMAALPASGWEARSPRAWSLPVAVFALLLALAVALPWAAGSLGAGHAAAAPSIVGIAAAVLGLVRAALSTGAGLLGATWKSMGLVVSELLASRLLLAAFAAGVVSLDLLLFHLLRGSRAAGRSAARSAAPRDRPR
jgi:anti-sigma factor RsiW